MQTSYADSICPGTIALESLVSEIYVNFIMIDTCVRCRDPIATEDLLAGG